MEQPYFKETQRFWDVLWIKLLFFGILAIASYSQYSEAGANGFLSVEFLSVITAILFVVALFYVMKLEVSFDAYGINYRFFPFHIKTYRINWSEIDVMYIRPYSPIGEYGGWGIRFGMMGSGTAYNISGNIGLQVMTGKRRILFGTKQPEAMEQALRGLFQNGTIKGTQLTDGGVALMH